MTSYFISVLEERSTWRMTHEEFISALKRRWPEVTVSERRDTVYFEMEPGHGHGYVFANFQSTGDSVVVEMVDDMRDIVTIAIWFRSLVPEGLHMQLFDEGYNEIWHVDRWYRVEKRGDQRGVILDGEFVELERQGDRPVVPQR